MSDTNNQPGPPKPGLFDLPETDFPGEGEPAFLDPERAEAIGYVENDDATPDFSHWDNHREPDPDPNRPVLKGRHKELARYHALGKTNNEICALLGYSVSRVSILLKNPVIQREVDRYRNRLYEKDLVRALKDLGQDSVEVIEQVLKDEKVKISERVNTAKWVLEKNTGRPKQEVSVESNSLAAFMELARQMRDAGESLRDINQDGDGIGRAGRGEILEGELVEDGDGDRVTTKAITGTGSRFDGKIADLLKKQSE